MLGKILVFEENEKTIAAIHRLGQIDKEVSFYFATDAREGMDQMRKETFDMILLCPECSGVVAEKTVEQIRLLVPAPIIVMTHETREVKMLNYYAKGIDDYMIKPISTFELAARIKAIYRRGSIQKFYEENTYMIGANEIKLKNFSMTKNGSDISLTHSEYAILKLLSSHPDHVFTKSEICQRLWQYEDGQYGNILSVHIRRTRQKIEDDPAHPTIIVTRWGIGYQFGKISRN